MSDGARYRVLVCRGVSCSGFFADDVFRALRKEVEKKGLGAGTIVERGGCFGGCGGGVTVIVRSAFLDPGSAFAAAYEDTLCAPAAPAGSEAHAPFGADDPTVVAGAAGTDDALANQVVYPEVMEPDVPRIVKEHLIGGRAIESMRVARRGAKVIR